MTRRFRRFLLMACLGLAAPAWAAEPPLDWARSYAGAWTLSGVTEGAPYCRLTLGSAGVIGGASVDVSATCRRNFPLDEVAGWTLRAGAITLIDPLRKAVLTFRRAQGGGYTAILSNGDMLSLDKGAPDAPKSRRDLLNGTFTLSGPNNGAPCGFMLTARTDNEGMLEQAGRCPRTWKSKPWKKWKFTPLPSEGRLDLMAADGRILLSLVHADAFTFTAEGAEQPLFFGPGVIEAE